MVMGINQKIINQLIHILYLEFLFKLLQTSGYHPLNMNSVVSCLKAVELKICLEQISDLLVYQVIDL